MPTHDHPHENGAPGNPLEPTKQPEARTPREPQEVVQLLHDPAVCALLAVLAAVLLFWFGTQIGAALHRAFDGDTGATIAFGAILLLVPATLVALGVAADRWLDTRRDQGS